jgi:hypothetical protein
MSLIYDIYTYLCAFVGPLPYLKITHLASQCFYVYVMAVTIQQVTYWLLLIKHVDCIFCEVGNVK